LDAHEFLRPLHYLPGVELKHCVFFQKLYFSSEKQSGLKAKHLDLKHGAGFEKRSQFLIWVTVPVHTVCKSLLFSFTMRTAFRLHAAYSDK